MIIVFIIAAWAFIWAVSTIAAAVVAKQQGYRVSTFIGYGLLVGPWAYTAARSAASYRILEDDPATAQPEVIQPVEPVSMPTAEVEQTSPTEEVIPVEQSLPEETILPEQEPPTEEVVPADQASPEMVIAEEQTPAATAVEENIKTDKEDNNEDTQPVEQSVAESTEFIATAEPEDTAVIFTPPPTTGTVAEEGDDFDDIDDLLAQEAANMENILHGTGAPVMKDEVVETQAVEVDTVTAVIDEPLPAHTGFEVRTDADNSNPLTEVSPWKTREGAEAAPLDWSQLGNADVPKKERTKKKTTEAIPDEEISEEPKGGLLKKEIALPKFLTRKSKTTVVAKPREIPDKPPIEDATAPIEPTSGVCVFCAKPSYAEWHGLCAHCGEVWTPVK